MMHSTMSAFWSIPIAASVFATSALAGLPSAPEGLTTVHSKTNPGVSLSYKQTTICETTSGVKAYSGYVHLPSNINESRPYDINTFFWFFEARKNADKAPLALWLQGGPGVPSITAAVGEHGPCNVTEDSKTTELNPFSWNNEVNMLYIDQPVQVGFSYDTLVNGTISEVASPFAAQIPGAPGSALPAGSPLPPENGTIRNGIFPSQMNTTTANTTQQAASAIWNFMQTWTQEFPEYKPPENKLSIWSESYGGHYGPTFADYFESQNELIAKGDLQNATPLKMEALGLINACVDAVVQMPFYPQMAFNNTYGIKAINQTAFDKANEAFPQCERMTKQCRELVAKQDPDGLGNDLEVNKACAGASKFCFGAMAGAYGSSGLDLFDIGRAVPNSFPPKYAAGYFNTKEVQQALGVPLNFTGNSVAVSGQFGVTGDFMRDGNIQAIGRLLDRGVKVAFMYGDRDFQCNWLGGEAVSLALNFSQSEDFRRAGYARLENGNSVGGAVRQYGNLSFSRIFDAGHSVPYFQPETAFNLFNRVMFNKDVATGKLDTTGEQIYASEGDLSTFGMKNNAPAPQPNICYTWDVMETCTKEQAAMLSDGSAITKDFIMVGYKAANGSTMMYPRNTGDAAPSDTPKGAATRHHVALSTGLVASLVCLFFNHL